MKDKACGRSEKIVSELETEVQVPGTRSQAQEWNLGRTLRWRGVKEFSGQKSFVLLDFCNRLVVATWSTVRNVILRPYLSLERKSS